MQHQINMFELLDEPLSWIDQNLTYGSGFGGGKIRIYAAALSMSMTNFAKFLKDEYGVGGRSIKDGFMDYGPKGIELRKWHEEYNEKYSWAEIANKIKKLISTDRYLTDKEKEIVKEIQNIHEGFLPAPYARFKYE